MAADYLIDPSQSPSGNRYQSLAALEADSSVNKNRSAANLGRPTEVEIVTNLTENYSWANWTTDSTNSILVYMTSQSVKIICAAGYTICQNLASKHIEYRGVRVDLNNQNVSEGIRVNTNGLANRCKVFNSGTASIGINVRNGGIMKFCWAYDVTIGLDYDSYSANFIRNCNAHKCTTGVRRNGGGGGSTSIKNTVAYGNTTNWSTSGGTFNNCRNNAGISGDTIPDTVGSTTITGLVDGDFVDYTNDNFHITSTSRLRHNHTNYPSGNNTTSGDTLDIDLETLPTYSTDADRWDTGADYYVLIVVGTRYYIAVNVSAASDSTGVKRDSDNADFTLADLVAEDTLEIRSGAVVHFAQYSYLKGIKLEVLNGEFWLENNSTTVGRTLFGILGGDLIVGAQGKFLVRGELIELADLSGGAYSSVRDLDNGEWDGVFGTGTKDSLTEYGEPSVLFVGTTAGAAVPYFNESNGTTVGGLANDLSHGRVFRFNPSNGNITWPENVPSTSMKVYCWNLVVHSQNGQGLPSASFAFDTSAKGAVDWQKGYFTGNPNFVDANGLKLLGFGILQPLTVDHCSGVELDVYQGLSQTNEQLGTNLLKDLAGQAAAGSFHGLMNGTGLKVQKVRSCVFTKLFMEGFGSQTSGAYRIVIEGTDDVDFGTVEVIDGGISFEGSISINPKIGVLNHSNDQSGSNGNNSQHVVNGAATGTRGLRIAQINLLTDGFPTALDIFSLNNSGNAVVTDINYNAVVRRILFAESCFDILISDVTIARCTEQAFETPTPPAGRSSGIVLQGVRNTSSPSSPPSFGEYSAEDVKLKNVAFENSGRYTGWTNPVTDLNFMELNLGNGTTGVLVLNFYQSTKGIYTFTGTAKSDNGATVLLPAVNDRVEVEWPYDILVGGASPYFQNATPTLVGTGTGNLTVEYAVSVNGAAYGSWKTLSGANLSGETLTTKFRIKFRVTCATAAATNAIKQVILDTNIDDTVNYPSALVDVTIRNLKAGARYWLRNEDTGDVLASGTIGADGNVTVSDVPYSGVDEDLLLRVRDYRTPNQYLPVEMQGVLTAVGADFFVSQILDPVA